MRRNYLAAAAALLLSCSSALAQQFTLPPNSAVSGHIISQDVAPPTGTNCAVAAGSTDTDGSCTTSSTSGAIVFGGRSPANAVGYITAPNCVVVDASSTTVPPTYTVTNLQITLTTIITAHVLRWHCAGINGG